MFPIIIEKGKNFLHKLYISVIAFFERLFTWKGELKKIIEWTDRNNLKIIKIEGCLYFEAGFSSSQISRGHSCAKMEVVNGKGQTEGLYLMAYNWADAGLSKSRFVPLDEIKFFEPYKIVGNKLVSLNEESRDQKKSDFVV